MSSLKYYQQVLDAIDRKDISELPEDRSERGLLDGQICELERRCQITVPEAVQDLCHWPYLIRFLPEDTARAIGSPNHFIYEEPEQILIIMRTGDARDVPLDRSMMDVIKEVCRYWKDFGIRLGQADPEVVVRGYSDPDHPRLWERHTDHFSNFILDQVRGERSAQEARQELEAKQAQARKAAVSDFVAEIRARSGRKAAANEPDTKGYSVQSNKDRTRGGSRDV
jgi:hypothetical protein